MISFNPLYRSLDPLAASTSPTSPMPSPYALLVCSLGNPAPYSNTLHSAGHIVLNALRQSLAMPPFQRSRTHGNGELSVSPLEQDYTLWQSASLMNVSGAGVGQAWRAFAGQLAGWRREGRLVIVHDELELGLGVVKCRRGETGSLKGHNGLKSVREVLASQGIKEWWRVGVGIGRPDSREKGVVSKYVLRKCSQVEKKELEAAAFDVQEVLREIKEDSETS